MKFLHKLLSKKIKEFRSLETAVRDLPQVSLSEDKVARMKKDLMRSITVRSEKQIEEMSFETLIAKIKALAAEINPSPVFKMFVKEKLMLLMEFNSQQTFSRWPSWLRQHKKVWATALLMLFVFTTVFNFTFNINRVEASAVTILEESIGDVSILRDSIVIPGTAGIYLRTDDVIRTGFASKAVIRFLDQSVSRLDENTEVKISKLFVNPLNKTETMVEIVLDHGRLWARVVSLIDNFSNFKVKAKNTVATAKKKAAFDVSLSANGQATVSAVHNKIDLTVATDKKVIETTLVKGYTAKVESDLPALPQIQEADVLNAANNQWVADNLAQDKVYIETVKQEAQDALTDQVKMSPYNPLYGVKELSEGTKLAMTIDDFERQKKSLYMAQEKFAEAQAVLAKGDLEKGQSLLGDFQSQVKAVFDWAVQAEAVYPEKALELENMVTAILNEYQKKLSLMLPEDPLYGLKEVISQTLISVATNPQQKTEQMLSRAGDKLLEAHDLAEQGNTVAAKKQVEAYSQAISDVVAEVKQMPTDAKEKAVSALLDNKMEDLKTLETITKTLPRKEAGTSTEEIIMVPDMAMGIATKGSSTLGIVSIQLDTDQNSTPASETESMDQDVPTAAETDASNTADLKKSVAEVKTETLTKLGEAVFDVQKDQPSSEVLKRLDDIKKIDVNGKPLVNVTLTKDKVTIKSSESIISVTSGTSTATTRPAAPETTTITPPTRDSKTQVLLPAPR